MSLKSCDTCGYALAILSDKCRHCSGSDSLGALAWKVDPRLLLVLALLVFGLGALIFRAVFH